MAGLFSSPSPPPLPPVPPPPPIAAEAGQEQAEIEAEARSAQAMVDELRQAAGRRGRSSTILAGGYDVDQPGAVGAKTLLGG